MQTFNFKDGGDSSVVTIEYDAAGIATLHHVKTFTTGVGSNRVQELICDDHYKRLPRGSGSDDVWSLLSAGTYRTMPKSHVPWEVSKTWVLAANPIKKSDKDKAPQKKYVDVDSVEAYLKRAGRQRNFDA